jgi:hypothetical protein
VVSVLAVVCKVRGFKPAEDDVFLRAMNIRSAPSVSRRPSAVRFYSILIIPAEYDRDTSLANFKDLSRPSFSLLRYLVSLLLLESSCGYIRND